MDIIHSFEGVKCVVRHLQTKIASMDQGHFKRPQILEYCSKAYTIAPRMVLFDIKFDSPLSRGYTIIMESTNIFQRLHIFLDSSASQQQSVQNALIGVQFKINLRLLPQLLEYLFI